MKRPILRYHGGKWKLAPWIIGHFPPHRTYVEPFGGGGSILLRKPRSYAEVYNDIWSVVVNVFQVARDPAMAVELERRLRLTPFARDEFVASCLLDGDDQIERARKAIVRSFMGFGSASTNGEYPTGFRANSTRSGTSPAHDWANYPDNLRGFTERLQGVIIENRDACQIIETHDSPEALHYVDPPYPHETRNMDRGNAAYAHEMSDAEHERLAKTLLACSGMVLISTYQSELYLRLFAGWRMEEIDALADGAVDRREVLFMNPACAARQRQHRLI